MDNLEFDDMSFEELNFNEDVEENNNESNTSEENTNADQQDLDLEDLMSSIEPADTTKENKNKKTKSEKPKPEPKKESKYLGPRTIIVYGDKIWVENDPNVTNEEIRERLVEEFGYSEFKTNVLFDLNEEDGILCVGKSFQKKG